jgi:hypothetical protein
MKTFKQFTEAKYDKFGDRIGPSRASSFRKKELEYELRKEKGKKKYKQEELEKSDDDPCWKGYVQLGTKKKDGKEVPNCVPKESVKESTELQERSPWEELKVMLSKKFNKNYSKALEWMKDTGRSAADAAKLFRGTDARELDKMYGMMEEVELEEGKLIKNMRVQNIHNGNKGTVVKGGDKAGGRVEVEWDDGKTTVAAGKYLKPIKEEVAANSVAGGGVDLNPTGYAKRDKRKKGDMERMYRRAQGMSFIEKLIKKHEK